MIKVKDYQGINGEYMGYSETVQNIKQVFTKLAIDMFFCGLNKILSWSNRYKKGLSYDKPF